MIVLEKAAASEVHEVETTFSKPSTSKSVSHAYILTTLEIGFIELCT